MNTNFHETGDVRGNHGPQIGFLRLSIVIFCLLMVLSWAYIGIKQDSPGVQPLSTQTISRGAAFVGDLIGTGDANVPRYREKQAWVDTSHLAAATLAMSIIAAGLAGIGALMTFIFAANNVMRGDLAPNRGGLLRTSWLTIIRFSYAITRAVPELTWAMLLIFILSPGILPGAIALSIHNFGILGKLSAEVVEGLDPRPARALRSSGASWFQVMIYAILPAALPRFLLYLLYRWEVIIRTTLVVGLVAAGGLGMEFRLAMSHFHYTTVMLLLFWYLILVIGVDLVAIGLRRLAR